MSAGGDAEVALIKNMIESVKPSFAGSDIDQETLAKLELLWIKKLRLLEEADHEDQDSGLHNKDSQGSLGDDNKSGEDLQYVIF